MKCKNRPKFVVLTHSNISIGEFKTKRHLHEWSREYQDKNRPIVRILSGPEIDKTVYLPIFNRR